MNYPRGTEVMYKVNVLNGSDFINNNTRKQMDKRIETIVRHFDWHRVEQTMKLLKWKGVDSEQEESIPSLGELYLTAIDLLEHVSELDGKHTIGTGGFEATRYEEGDLELKFVLTSWKAYNPEVPF